jgi:hypothetical protein
MRNYRRKKKCRRKQRILKTEFCNVVQVRGSNIPGEVEVQASASPVFRLSPSCLSHSASPEAGASQTEDIARAEGCLLYSHYQHHIHNMSNPLGAAPELVSSTFIARNT